jgi:flagellar basal body-associated protein FliL
MEFLKRNKKMIIIAVVVIAVIAVAYFMFFKKKDESGATVMGGEMPKAPEAKATSSDPKVQATIDKIYSDAKWLADITAKAATNGKTVSEQVLLDAQWVNRPK